MRLIRTAIVLPFVAITTVVSAQTEAPQQVAVPPIASDDAAGVEPAWSLIADNGAFQLREWKLLEERSLIHGVFFESDAQMGIAICAEIGLLSEKKDCSFFRFVRDEAEVEKFKPVLSKLPETASENVKHTSTSVIEFFKERPAEDEAKPRGEQVMDAALFAHLARMARETSAQRQGQKKRVPSKD